jgi:hypothetical protein
MKRAGAVAIDLATGHVEFLITYHWLADHVRETVYGR